MVLGHNPSQNNFRSAGYGAATTVEVGPSALSFVRAVVLSFVCAFVRPSVRPRH